ncbi:putative sulfatase [Bacteroides pyogenes JCM 6292]|uniref:Putative sulfatase n=1 Tax=Bacteroides pyogenes JCM 6292 TaxID=1235809 RepID=W4PAD4_9BACE|nr:putative sulfatase [Bacteroides pyogenes JCM 6292]
MKKRIFQFLITYLLFVFLFILQKPIFMVYYHELYSEYFLTDYLSVIWHGLPLDLSVAGYLTLIPGILLAVSAGPIRRYFTTYAGFISVWWHSPWAASLLWI